MRTIIVTSHDRHMASRMPRSVAGPVSQVCDLAQVFETVSLGRDRIGVGIVHGADKLDTTRLDLDGLALALALDQLAANDQRAARCELEDVAFVVGQGTGSDDLDRLEAGAVVQVQERQAGFRVPPGAEPALDRDLCSGLYSAGEDVADQCRGCLLCGVGGHGLAL